MSTRLTHDGVHLSSIWQINRLPEAIKHGFYCSLIPLTLLPEPCTVTTQEAGGQQDLSIRIRCPENAPFVEIDVRHADDPRDPVLYVQMADTSSGQLEVLLVRVVDPHAPRFDIDRDWRGETTKLGTLTRNIPAEIGAMDAGLAPGQVRRGLRLSRELIPVMERFTAGLGKDRFFIEPLAYHNAIMFERYGFAYMVGHRKMEEIQAGFQPGGALFEQLDGSTPFRQPGAERSVRGRSWAIHDGILGEPWADVRMYKRIGHCADVCTFPNATY
jgi:hypothetical protein